MRRRGLFAVVYVATCWRKVEPPKVCGGTVGYTQRASARWAASMNEHGRHKNTRYEVRRMPDWLVEIVDREHAYQAELRERGQASRDREFAAIREWERQMAEGLI